MHDILYTESSNAPELVKIQTGQLYLMRPGNIRSSRECMYVQILIVMDHTEPITAVIMTQWRQSAKRLP